MPSLRNQLTFFKFDFRFFSPVNVDELGIRAEVNVGDALN